MYFLINFLAPGFYYINAIEMISSCLEMQTIMTKNVINHIKKNHDKSFKTLIKNE